MKVNLIKFERIRKPKKILFNSKAVILKGILLIFSIMIIFHLKY
jgi:hypothetical protein